MRFHGISLAVYSGTTPALDRQGTSEQPKKKSIEAREHARCLTALLRNAVANFRVLASQIVTKLSSYLSRMLGESFVVSGLRSKRKI